MMRLNKLFLLVFIFGGIIVFAAIVLNKKNSILYEPPKNIPSLSFWKGGADGGFWYHFERIKDNRYQVRMFYKSGVLYKKEQYILVGDIDKRVSISSLFQHYDGYFVFLTNGSYFQKQSYPLKEKPILDVLHPNKKVKYQ